MTSQMLMSPAGTQVNQSTKSDILRDKNNIDINQDNNPDSEGFDDLLVGMLADNESSSDVNTMPGEVKEVTTGNENLPSNGDILPLGQSITLDIDVEQTDIQISLPESESVPETESAIGFFSLDNVSSSVVNKPLSPVKGQGNSDAFIKQPLNQFNPNNILFMDQKGMSGPQQGASLAESASTLGGVIEQELVALTNKSGQVTDEKTVLLGTNTDIGRLAKQFAESRSVDKTTAKLTALKSVAAALNGDSSEAVVSLSNSNNSIFDVKPVTQLTLPQVITSPQWANDFGERIRWLLSNNIQKAEIRLNPGNLGMIEISIALNNDHTNIQISTQNSLTKEVLEQSVGRLREMLDESGAGQVNIDVSHHSEKDNTSNEHAKPRSEQSVEDDSSQVFVSEQSISDDDSLIDFYA